MKRLLYDRKWREAANALQAQGYTLREQEGIVPAVFQKPGEPDLYLYLPAEPGVRMGDRQWTPRPLADKPILFGVRDAAEHLGVAVSTIKHAISGKTDNPLVPDNRIGQKLLVFNEQSLLDWDKKRRGPGAAPTEKHMTYERLYLINRTELIEIAQRQFAAGTLPIKPFADAIAAVDQLNRWQLNELAQRDLAAFAQRLAQLPRLELIQLMAAHYSGDVVIPILDESDLENADDETTELEIA